MLLHHTLYQKAILRSVNDVAFTEVRMVPMGVSSCQHKFKDGWTVVFDGEMGIGISWDEGTPPKKSWILTSLVVRLNEIVENHGEPWDGMPPITTYDGFMIKSYELQFKQKPQTA